MSEEDSKILNRVKSLLNPDYSFERFILDAITNKKLRYHQREKKARRKVEKAAAAAALAAAPPPEAKAPPPPPEPSKEEEKQRRPSLLNLAEIQAKFHQGLKEEQKIVIPPLITSTKVPAADSGLKK